VYSDIYVKLSTQLHCHNHNVIPLSTKEVINDEENRFKKSSLVHSPLC